MVSCCYAFGMTIDVVLIPVGVTTSGAPQVVAYSDAGTWLRAPLDGTPSATAQTLMSQLPTGLRHVLDERNATPLPLAFKERQGHTTLVFSVACPIPLADRGGPPDWIPLLAPPTKYSEARKRGSSAVTDLPLVETVLEWWAEQLEEKSAVLAFLPRHFTARQVRDVYNAFWGYEQDTDRFAEWSGVGPSKATGSLTTFVERTSLEDDDLVAEIAAALQRAHAAITGRPLELTAAVTLGLRASDSQVGINPIYDSGGHEVGLDVLDAAAAMVASQRRARGKRPTWFRRTADEIHDREKLERLWATRPAWMYPATQ